MATIADTPVSIRRKPGVKQARKHSLRIDMTPMVDLGFLLIAFFVITAQLSEPRSASLIMPKDGEPTPTPQSATITVILDKDKTIYYYEGDWEFAENDNQVIRSGFSYSNGIRMDSEI